MFAPAGVFVVRVDIISVCTSDLSAVVKTLSLLGNAQMVRIDFSQEMGIMYYSLLII